jgi:hypothetical protein
MRTVDGEKGIGRGENRCGRQSKESREPGRWKDEAKIAHLHPDRHATVRYKRAQTSEDTDSELEKIYESG